MNVLCPTCSAQLKAELKPDQIAECPHCKQRFRMPSERKRVTYLHHTRDTDGDVVFFFKEGDGPSVQSSPITSVQRSRIKPTFATGRTMALYVVTTQNSTYEVLLPKDVAEHLRREITGQQSD